MSSRDLVLGRITLALQNATPAPEIPRAYDRSGTAKPGSPDVIEQLVDRLVDYRAVVRLVGLDLPGLSDNELTHRHANLTDAVDAALGPATSVVVPGGLPAELVEAAGERTVTIDRPDVTAYDLDAIDAVLTCSRVTCSLTGTIILDGSADQGRRMISLVPDRHVVVVRAEQVVSSVPEAIAALNPTAPLTLISGPSATSDIELSRVEGVHGPRTLEVVIVG